MALPSLEHFNYADYEKFYEPSEDTFLLLDVLRGETESLKAMKPVTCLEIG